MVTSTGHMWRVTQVATGVAGSPYYLTHYFDKLTGTAQQAADAWRNFLSAGVSTYTAPMIFNPITEVGEVDPTTGDLVGLSVVSVAGITFTGAGDPLPPATSFLIRWRTGIYLNGKEVRGRTNIPRLAETDNTLGVPNAALITAWQTRLNTLLTAATPSPVVYSPKNGLFAYVTAASPSNSWAVLRSRRD